ncbi:MAG: Smr/MutS family protein [Vicinamibacterales bacterium]
MQSGTRRTLEFDRIVTALGRLTQTPLGREAIAQVVPRTDPAEVRRLLRQTSEMRRHLALGGSISLSAPDDIEPIRAALSTEGLALEPLELRGLAALASDVESSAAGIRKRSDDLPLLVAMIAGLTSFRDEVAAVRRSIDAAGDVVDDASPALRQVRERLRRQRQELRAAFERLVRGRGTTKYLQDQVVTDRHGRFVVTVRAEHRDSVPGIVHGASASGASLFVEPLATVPLNNEIVELTEREREEVYRVLLALTERFRARRDGVEAAIDAVAALDRMQAQARLADLTRAIEPEIADTGGQPVLEWRAARHPLLIPAVRRLLTDTSDTENKPGIISEPVPVDIVISPPTRTLVISGPNTGGKTVALKAAGLLALMAQAGLHVPAADGSRTTVFSCIFADIGDEQSIAASLSTFSGHMTNIASMDKAFALPALILLDEVGSGTDPLEGGALGMAIVDHFRQRGALVIATTHDDAMKSYAATTDGVTVAAFGFDPQTFAPSYRLLYGMPGRSLALEIAARLGLPASVIAEARRRRTTRETQLEAHLARVEHDMQALDHDRRLAAKAREDASAERERLHAREAALRDRELQLRRRVDAAVEERVREAREEIERTIARLKQKAGALEAEAKQTRRPSSAPGPRGLADSGAITTGDLGRLRTEAREGVARAAALAKGFGEAPDETAVADYVPAIGDRVRTGSLGFEGIVRAVEGNQAELDVLGKRIKARIADLRPASAPQGGASAGKPQKESARGNVSVSLAERSGASTSELNVIGCTVDEATSRAEKFLDESLLTDTRTLRVVHGHGTGQLRKGLTAFLRDHPLVAKVTPAPPDQGGNAVMIVEIKD